MPDKPFLQSTGDLLEYVEHPLARKYIRLLDRCARGEQTVGVLEDTIQPDAVTDWEAAMIVDADPTVGEITEIRETLCRKSPLIVRGGSRKGKPTWTLHDDFITD